MLKKSVKIIAFIVMVCSGFSLYFSSPLLFAKNPEEVWNFYNNQLNGGAVYQVIVDPTSQNWYCTVNKISLYTKKQGNDYWEKIPLPQTNTYIQYIYPFSSYFLMASDQGMYLYQGQNQEQSIWEEVETPMAIKTIEILKTSYQNKDIYWLATSSGLFFSYDAGGENPDKLFQWHMTNLNVNLELKDLWFDNETKTLYVLASDGWLYMKKEPELPGELEWNRIRLSENIHHVQQFCTGQGAQKTWIISTEDQGLFISNDSGISWENISKDLPNLYISQMNLMNEDVYTATYGGFYIYHLNTGRWSKIGNSLFNEQINCFAVDEDNQKVIIGTNGNGIWTTRYSGENGIWLKDDQKIEGILVKKMIKNQSENKILLSTWGAGIYVTSNNGLNWKQSNQGLTNPYLLSLYYESDEKIWAGTFNGGLFLSKDFGESWNQIKSSTLLSSYVYSILVDRKNTNVIYIGTNRTILKSNNQGESWNTLNLGTEDKPVGNILTIEQDWADPNIIYAGTDSSGVYVSKDGGESWFPSQNGLPFRTINQLYAIPHQKNILIAATNGDGCYLSENQGNSWVKIEGPQQNMMVYDIIDTYEKTPNDDCFISTENGIFRLNLLTKVWNSVGNGLQQTSIRSLLYYKNQLWAGTYGKGVARLINLPSPPIPMEPANLAEITKTRIMFRWSESSYSEYPVLYKVQIATDQDFKDIFYLSGTISGDQWLIPENVLKRHHTYYWRVRGETILGNTEWSKSYHFTIVTIIQMQIKQSEIQINGQSTAIDSDPKVTPVIKDNRTFLPIRVIIEAWEGTIQWDSQIKKVTIQVNGNNIQLTIQQPIALVNGKSKKIDENSKVVPFILNGRTMLPLRFIAENLQAQVEWDNTTQRITLIYPMRRTT
ncbi:YCF48-related protein [bacterium]|nr:YCF48-related protein [bacterium]